MNRHLSRLLAAALAFSVGVGIERLLVLHRVEDSATTPSTILPRAAYPANAISPYTFLEGSTVRLKPYDATFDIPEGWLNPPPTQKNLFLSREELDEAYRNAGGDEEYERVMDSVLPFEKCAAHVGDKDWGNYLWNDLQARMYVVESSPEEIADRVTRQGLDKATNTFTEASLLLGGYGKWERRTLRVTQASSDFILSSDMDFYYRTFGNRTVVFVFIHAEDYKETIPRILDSFRWSAGA
jgi:hypothetical protein